MNDTPWTYHEFHHSPRRKTYSVMEGIRVVASCSREKDARLIVRLYNEHLHKELVRAEEPLEQCKQCFYKKIAKEKDGWCYMFKRNDFLDSGGKCVQFKTKGN